MDRSETYDTYLLVRLAAHGEYTILLSDLVLLSSAWLVLEIALKPMDNVPTAMRGSIRQVRCLQVVNLDLKQSLQGKYMESQ